MAAGGWQLARTLGVPVAGAGRLWPALLVVAGVGFLLDYALSRGQARGLVLPGLGLSLAGGLLLAATLGEPGGRQWPLWVLAAGAAGLAAWLAGGRGGREPGLLLTALLALAVGGTALAARLGWLPPEVAAGLARWWPLGLIGLGLWLLVPRGRRR